MITIQNFKLHFFNAKEFNCLFEEQCFGNFEYIQVLRDFNQLQVRIMSYFLRVLVQELAPTSAMATNEPVSIWQYLLFKLLNSNGFQVIVIDTLRVSVSKTTISETRSLKRLLPIISTHLLYKSRISVFLLGLS